MTFHRRKGKFCSGPLIYNPTVHDPFRGSHAAADRLSGLRRGGAMAGEAELAGARGPANSEHHFSKEKHQGNEKLTTTSLETFARTEEQRVRLVACGSLV